MYKKVLKLVQGVLHVYKKALKLVQGGAHVYKRALNDVKMVLCSEQFDLEVTSSRVV